jgi:outer membrane biosynthesis protein TonB
MAFVRKQPPRISLFRMGILSLLIHAALIAFFTLNPWPTLIRTQPLVYTVTLMPLSFPEPEIPKAQAMPERKEPPPKPPPPIPVEKKPVEKPKKDDIVEKVKPAKKIQKVEKPNPEKPKLPEKPKPPPEKPKQDEKSLQKLQEALEDIRRKAALEEIRKKIALREKAEKRPPVKPTTPPSKVSSETPPSAEQLESKLNAYYSLVWAKIKDEWTIPENLLKDMVDLETIIVIIIERDGKIQRSWFEKKSGNDLYDQMAMRALLKADPLPPIPKELSESTLEVGVRFIPD